MDNLVNFYAHSLIPLANDYRFSPGERIERDCVSSRMQLWCHSGSGSVIVNDQHYELRAGSVVFMPWKHRIIYQATHNDPMYVSGIHLIPFCHPPETISWFQVAHDQQHPLHGVPWLQDRPIPGFEACSMRSLHLNHPLLLLSNYIVSVFQRASLEETNIRQLSLSLLAEWQRLRSQTETPMSEALERACAAITLAPQEHRSLEAYARIAACSPSTLNRQARKQLGCTLLQWQRKQQMLSAADQLRSSQTPIQAIATALGFDDPLYFSRSFKQEHGMSPRAYRERFAVM